MWGFFVFIASQNDFLSSVLARYNFGNLDYFSYICDMKMQGERDFKKDLHKGKVGENIIKNYLISLGFAFLESCDDHRYDLKMLFRNKEYTYEVKTDMYPKDTGNIVIEFESRHKPSGVSVTEADYFVTYFFESGEVWRILTSKLRLMIDYLKPHIFERAGDKGSNTKLYSFKKNQVAKFFKIHKI